MGQPLVIGQHSASGPNDRVDGTVTGLKIYQRALTAEEVARKATARP